jgi:glycosyltransferase involved in cell wall biosynthesis
MLVAAAMAARSRGYETTICFSEIAHDRPWLDELSDLADVRFIDSSGPRATMPQLKQILDETKGQPTILHTHFGAFDESAALVGLGRADTAVLWHAHSAGPRAIRLRSKAHGAIFGRMVDGVLCVSPEIYEEGLRRRIPPDKLLQLPNAIDLARFSAIAPAERAAARRELGLSDTAEVVLHFGWDWRRKGGDLMLATAELMTDHEPDASGELMANPEPIFLTVLGEGSERAPDELFSGRPAVRALAPGEARELYAAADVFLNCSRAEGMPYALLEALARGLLVVATDLPVQREMLDGLIGARVVAPEPGEIAAGLHEVLALPLEQRREHASAGRARVASSHALEPWSQRLVDLYDKALSHSGRS